MKPIRIAFFDAKPYDEKFFNAAVKDRGISITYFPVRLSADNAKLAAGFDGVCIFVNDSVTSGTAEILHKEGVKLIALRCAGYNNVDLSAVFGRIHVVRVPAYSPHAVAEHAVALMLSLNRKTHRAYYRTRDSNFALNGLLGFDMFGKTAGIIGTGLIGRITAGILLGFGMKVLAHDPYPAAEWAEKTGVSYVPLSDLYKNADIISLHCPLTPENVHMIDAEAIKAMKDDIMIINTGRGKLIDSRALVDGLKNRKIGSAGLDVYEEESEYFFEDHSSRVMPDDVLARLLTFPNVLVTGHQAFFTREALMNIADTTLANITAFFDNSRMENEICYKCGAPDCAKKTLGRCF